MALTTCPECSKEVSTDAARCPHCGKKLKTGMLVKLLLSALAFIVLLMGIEALTPKYKTDAMDARRVCERDFIPGGLAAQADCDKMYRDAMAGR